MTGQISQKTIVIIVSVLSLLLTMVSTYVIYMGEVISDLTVVIWSAVFSLLMALWTSLDARARKLYKPFEYSFFVCLFWPLVLPYHLVKTRGHEGFLMYAGIFALYLLPFFVDIVTWAYFVQ